MIMVEFPKQSALSQVIRGFFGPVMMSLLHKWYLGNTKCIQFNKSLALENRVDTEKYH